MSVFFRFLKILLGLMGITKRKIFLSRKQSTMMRMPTNPDYVWNYSFYQLMDLGVEIDEDWCSVGNIDYDALDDLRGNYPHLFEDEANGWDEITQETI
jgi:hypothetical protein